MAVTENPFLSGNYAPVREELTDADLDVDGGIPTELQGRYVRTGPNPCVDPAGSYHWFLGDGMVHGVVLADGSASYRNRYVLGDPLAAAMGLEPLPGPEGSIGMGNTNVVAHAGRILALTETLTPIELSPDLESLRKWDFGGPLPGGFTAHPKADPVTGELHGFTYGQAEPYLTYLLVDADGRLARTEPITVPGPTMVHDFVVTRRHVVFFDLPVVFDTAIGDRTPFPYRWDDDYGARVGVMPRGGADTDVRWFDIDPCYVFHPANGYDDGGRVVVDVVRHERTFATDDLQGPNDDTLPTLDRWTIDLAGGTVTEELISERGQEFPRINETRLMDRHRYVWADALVKNGAFDATMLLAHDLERGTTQEHSFGAGRFPGEFVFVPGQGETVEDAGWLVGYVYDATVDRSDFVILDATSFGGAAVATVHLPVRVPFGFHGSWIPDPR